MATNLQVFIVAGNIGAGKSTTLSCLKNIDDLSHDHVSKVTEFCLENVESWNHFLTQMYIHPKESKFKWLLQLDVLSHFLQVAKVYDTMLEKALANPSIQYRLVVERSPNEVIDIFMKTMDDASKPEDKCLVDCYRNMIKRTNLWSNPNNLHWVWVKCPPQSLVHRVQARNRPGEKEGLPEDALSELDNAYASFFDNVCKKDNVIVINNPGTDVAQFIKNLMEFYHKHF